jgi:glucose-6-phosphate isomerase
MWDWVGGRTSVTSVVGLLPLALQGVDIDAFLEGAAAMDRQTRQAENNPALLLAQSWYALAPGSLTGESARRRAMVMIPYRDRLSLLSQYLQQLIMESLGKELDLQGRPVYQGLTVFGNKGSTDQHAYVQQLRDGADDCFATLIGVQEDGYLGEEVEVGIDSGDYLQGFLLGTWKALSVRHPVVLMTLSTVDAFRMGALIALFERTVGLYATRIGINAYHQPGVEAGKKAAAALLSQKAVLVGALTEAGQTVEQLCKKAGLEPAMEYWYLLSRLAANGHCRVGHGATALQDQFSCLPR